MAVDRPITPQFYCSACLGAQRYPARPREKWEYISGEGLAHLGARATMNEDETTWPFILEYL